MTEIVNPKKSDNSPKNEPVNVDGAENNGTRGSHSSRVITASQQTHNDSDSDTEASDENMIIPSSQTEIEGEKVDEESDEPGRNSSVTAQKIQGSMEKSRPNVQQLETDAPKKLSPACPSCRKHKVGCKHRYLISVNEGTGPSKGRSKKRKRVSGENAQVGDNNNNNNTSTITGTWLAKCSVPMKKSRQIRFEDEEDDASNEFTPPRRARTAKKITPGQLLALKNGKSHKSKLNRVEEDDEEGLEIGSEANISSESPLRKQSKRGRKPNAERATVSDTTTATTTTKTGDKRAGKAPVIDSTVAGPSRGFPVDNLQGAIHMSRHTTLSRELQQRLEDCDVKWGAAIDSLHSAKSLLDGWVESWQRGL